MKIWTLIVKEIFHRKLRLVAGVVAVAIAVGVLAGAVVLLRTLDAHTEQILQQARQEAEAQAKLPMPPGPPQDRPLVDLLAEIKMIRAMQMRVNRRTQAYAKLVEGEQASDPGLLEALRRLAERQAKIHQITRDLEMGKNR
jgi:cell division protein FtsX